MCTPQGGSDMALFEKHGRLKDALQKAEAEWEKAYEKMENL